MTGRRFRTQGSRTLTVLLLTALLWCVTLTGPVRAQTTPPASSLPADWQFGYHLFQLLLEQKGLTSISSFDEVFNHTPSDTVMVLVGDLSWIDQGDWSDIRSFLRSGGAVLVATDKKTLAPDLFMVREGPMDRKGPIEVSDERDAYQGFLDCPRIQNLNGSHDLSKNLDQLIGNRTGRISTTWDRGGRWTNVAYLPRYRDGGTQSPVIATMRTNDSRRGRLMVAADHSLFINGMLWHGNNAILALNTTDWLCSDRRRTLLFLSDGLVVRSGIPLPPSTPPLIPPEDIPPFSLEDLAETPPESIITFANTFITGLEDENVFNQVLANHASEMPAPELYQQLYLTVALIAGFWVISQLLQRGRRFESPAARPVVAAASTRVDDLVNSNDLQRPLRELARDLFRGLTGSDDPKDWSVWPKSLKVTGLHSLEKIATNVDRRPVSKRQFRRVVKQIERIRHLHEQGQLTHPRIHSNKIEDLSVITRHQ